MFGGKQGQLMRYGPPRISNCDAPIQLYLIEHIYGATVPVFRFSKIARRWIILDKKISCVQYDSYYWPLHQAGEIRKLLRELRAMKAYADGAFKHCRFNKNDIALPFTQSWEPRASENRIY